MDKMLEIIPNFMFIWAFEIREFNEQTLYCEVEVATVHNFPKRANSYKIDVTIGEQFVVGKRARNRFKIDQCSIENYLDEWRHCTDKRQKTRARGEKEKSLSLIRASGVPKYMLWGSTMNLKHNNVCFI